MFPQSKKKGWKKFLFLNGIRDAGGHTDEKNNLPRFRENINKYTVGVGYKSYCRAEEKRVKFAYTRRGGVSCQNVRRSIVHMTEVPLKHLFIKNLRKSASVPEALYSTYVNLVDTIASPGSHHQELNKSLMEPYLDLCYIPKEVPPASNYDFSFESCSSVGTSNESISAMFTQNMDLTKSAEQDGNLGNKRTKEMQRYKTMRKWKRFGKSEFFFFLILIHSNSKNTRNFFLDILF